MDSQKSIALVGNPNSGKSTFFNGLTGGKQKIGNWPGVTVEKIHGEMVVHGEKVSVVDLPGIYSLSASSEDERVSRDYLIEHGSDLVVNIIDAANIERNLYLTTQLLEMNLPVIVVLNRIDVAEKQGKTIDVNEISKLLGTVVLELSAIKKNSVNDVKEQICSLISSKLPKQNRVEYPNEIEDIISKLSRMTEDYCKEFDLDSRWLSLKILEKDHFYIDKLISSGDLTKDQIDKYDSKLNTIFGETSDVIIADYRYGFIHSIVKNAQKRNVNKREISDFIDNIVLNRFLGIPIFLFFMYIVFWLTLSFGGAFIGFFENISGLIFIDGTDRLLMSVGAPRWLITVLATGIGSGVQAVATFIPIIFMMFLLLSILEDSGYMARAAFVMDKLMRIIGLPGKAFLPLVIGFGCTVPAIMAARTLDEKKDRMITIFITPFMSCGARLSVYLLFAAAFFKENSGMAVFSLYIIGAALAILTGLLIKKTLYTGEISFFVMELPTYNFPRFRHIFIHTWSRLKQFLYSAGKIIIIAVFILSLLNSFGTDGTLGNENTEKSVLTKIGKSIAPIFSPMGIDEKNWQASVSIFSGPFAKEAVIGTLSTLYHIQEDSGDNDDGGSFTEKILNTFRAVPGDLKAAFTSILDPMGIESATRDAAGSEKYGLLSALRREFGSPFSAYAYLLFIMIYFPCLATVGAVYREAGGKVAVAQILYMTILAWIVSVMFYQFTVGFDVFWITASSMMLFLVILTFVFTGVYLKRRKKIG